MLVDALATNLELHILQQLLGGEEGGVGTGGVLVQHELNHDVSDQITVTGDLGGHLVAISDTAVDRLLDTFNRKICIPSVNGLEKSDLGVTGQIHVLCSIRD